MCVCVCVCVSGLEVRVCVFMCACAWEARSRMVESLPCQSSIRSCSQFLGN